jgi:YVTN family beta-propeller protein
MHFAFLSAAFCFLLRPSLQQEDWRVIRISRWATLVLLAGSLGNQAWAQGGPYVNFETIPNRALALSPNGSRLFVTNTPDGRLEIFNISATGGLTAAGSVSVGLDPIAVAARSNTEVWVVNHLSDSVSVVDVSATPRVVRTLNVGDEPRDIVFAGPGGNRAFITAARRGQNHPPLPTDFNVRPGEPRADVWVFDAANPGAALGGTPLTILPLFADKPGGLAVTPNGATVLVGIATSGNETTTINDAAVCGTNTNSMQTTPACAQPIGGTTPGGVAGPNRNQVDGTANPLVGIIVKFDRATGSWFDQVGTVRRDWRAAVQFTLPDNDVFAIDAMASPPRQSAVFQHVGTLNAGLAVHPTNGRTYVATIDAINTNRFISLPMMGAVPNPNMTGGAARTADPATGRTLNGHLYESRIAILSTGGGVVSRHLNKHIDYETVPSPAGVKERSVADPRGVVFSADGATLFVAALGSNAIASFPTAQLDNNSFTPAASNLIPLSGDGGPTDMVIRGNLMFVYKRFDNAVATVDLAQRREIASTPLFSPEPSTVRLGRKFFYDARLGSSNGEANCNVCHPNGDKDDLAWDLGAPFLGVSNNPNPFIFSTGGTRRFNPLKGPMTVLTLRGIKDSGPMFWRGDATNTANPLDERAAFQNFNVVFPALLGSRAPLASDDFSQLTDWALSILPPPNPHRSLTNADTGLQIEGRAVFMGQRGGTDGPFNCNTCHVLNPAQGFFGTNGASTFEGEPQEFKVTQLRTVYDKVGMFPQNNAEPFDPNLPFLPRVRGAPQVRGTGTLHDGSEAGPEDFLTDPQFQLNANTLRQVVDFVYAFPSNLAPVVGQQVTLRSDSGADVTARLNLLMQRAGAAFVLPGNMTRTECDLVAKVAMGGRTRGFLFQPQQGNFLDDSGAPVAAATVRGFAATPGQEVTFTCIYPGGGRRFGIDRNLNGTLDAAEVQPQQQLTQEQLVALAAFVGALLAALNISGGRLGF